MSQHGDDTKGDTAPSSSPGSVLRHDRNFRLLWLGETLSQTGSQISIVALPLVAVLVLHSGAGVVGLLTTAQYLPVLVLSLPAGRWVDRYSMRSVLLLCHLPRAVLIALIPVAYAGGFLSVGLLVADAFVIGSFSAVFDVAYVSYVPRLVSREHMSGANARLELTYSVAETAGPGIGGLLVQALGAALAPLADALTYVAAALLGAAIRTPGRATAPASDSGWRGMLQDTALGLRTIWSHPVLRPLVIYSAAFNLLGMVAYTLFLVFGVIDLHLPSAALGWILASASAGALVGASLAGRLAVRFGTGRTLVWAMMVAAVALGLIPAASGPTGVVVLLLIAGFVIHGAGLGAFNVHSLNMRAETVASQDAGRITGAWKLLSNGTIPLNGLLASGLGVLTGSRWAIAISVATLSVACLGMFRSTLPGYRSPRAGSVAVAA